MNGHRGADRGADRGANDGAEGARGESVDGDEVAAALARVHEDIARFATRHGREPGSVELLAVGKTKPVAAIAAAIAAGQRAFGENYVDEALGKIEALGHRVVADGAPAAEHPGAADTATEVPARDEPLEWHFIGTIQSRRCAAIAEHFDWAHGVDREKVARRLAERRAEHASPLNVCLQLNVDGEVSKSGVEPSALDALADRCAELPMLRLRGLMAIPAPRTDFDAQRRAFAEVRERFEALRERGHEAMDTLSMGMSGDLEAAIAEGATLVRVGTALFGARPRS